MTPPPSAAVADPLVRSGAALPAPVAPREQDRRPDLRVVRRRRRRWQVGTVAGIVLFVSLFAVAGFQTLIVAQQKRLDDVTDRIAVEADLARELDDQLAELESPQRITEVARERLGMVSPPGVVYIQPRPDDDARAAEVPGR